MPKTQAQIDDAQDELRSELVNVLGPDLPGVSGFGAGLDYGSRQLGLNVLVDSPNIARQVTTQLPKKIGGLRVRVSQRGPATFD